MLVACRQDDPALANPTWAYGGSVGVRLGLTWACSDSRGCRGSTGLGGGQSGLRALADDLAFAFGERRV